MTIISPHGPIVLTIEIDEATGQANFKYNRPVMFHRLVQIFSGVLMTVANDIERAQAGLPQGSVTQPGAPGGNHATPTDK